MFLGGVLHGEVSLIQRWTCTQLYVVGTADSVLIRESMYFLERFYYITQVRALFLERSSGPTAPPRAVVADNPQPRD